MPHRRQFLRHASAASLLAAAPSLAGGPNSARTPSQPTKIKDLIVYQNERFYCAFPSVVCRPDGELLVAFRRAQDAAEALQRFQQLSQKSKTKQ